MPPALHSLDCPKCGAPLRWKGEARVVECRYCGSSVLTPTGELTEERAEVRSQAKPAGAVGVILVVVGLNLAIGLIAAVASLLGGTGGGPLGGVSVAQLVKTPFQGGAAAMAEALGVSPGDDGESLTVPLEGSGFGYGWLRWDAEHLDQPIGACFYASDGHPRATEARARLTRLFGRRLVWDGDGSAAWRWGGAYVNVGEKVSNICFSADVGDPSWVTRARLLWSVFLAVVAEQDLTLQESTLEGWLGWGYTLTELSALDLRYDVDAARGYVPTLFAGAEQGVLIGLDIEVPLSHAWFGSATLHWPNERGGTLESVRLSAPPGSQTLGQQAAIGRCLEATFGKGEINEVDHLAATWSERWQARDGAMLRLDPYAVTVDLEGWPPRTGSSPQRVGTFRRAPQALDGCEPR
ncbi:MAG: hypothetical protein ABIO70_16180 [Pseudomonadota bacterium]